jgi:hypothetical protein
MSTACPKANDPTSPPGTIMLQELDYRWTLADARPHNPVTLVLFRGQVPDDPRQGHESRGAGVVPASPDQIATDLDP